ncbi:hypothetical protein CAOG_010018 [Capsaspora owczarzaki ATCC 30864]|uniref:Uncharacterized protein n=1 Tax=Capsaspora owczarzaki (strain ATCC 30864) TaxID=595528 RepID=A0A0D2WVT9_CAPO3|nr:hypothetical protein CAOG_010018 [Capsaspora owczarzaki ATCC 30864]
MDCSRCSRSDSHLFFLARHREAAWRLRARASWRRSSSVAPGRAVNSEVLSASESFTSKSASAAERLLGLTAFAALDFLTELEGAALVVFATEAASPDWNSGEMKRSNVPGVIGGGPTTAVWGCVGLFRWDAEAAEAAAAEAAAAEVVPGRASRAVAEVTTNTGRLDDVASDADSEGDDEDDASTPGDERVGRVPLSDRRCRPGKSTGLASSITR